MLFPPLRRHLRPALRGAGARDRTARAALSTRFVPILLGALALLCLSQSKGSLVLTMGVRRARRGWKRRPINRRFWSLPSLFLTETAAAGSIGFINFVRQPGAAAALGRLSWATSNSTTGSYVHGPGRALGVDGRRGPRSSSFLGLGRKSRPRELRAGKVKSTERQRRKKTKRQRI